MKSEAELNKLDSVNVVILLYHSDQGKCRHISAPIKVVIEFIFVTAAMP